MSAILVFLPLSLAQTSQLGSFFALPSLIETSAIDKPQSLYIAGTTILNLLARTQVMQCGSCVIHRTAQCALDCADAFCVQALLRRDRTEVYEHVTDFLFLLGQHPAMSITTVLRDQITLVRRRWNIGSRLT